MHGQEVNIDFWVVKNLDPGRERMYRVNGSDLPLTIFLSKNPQNLATLRAQARAYFSRGFDMRSIWNNSRRPYRFDMSSGCVSHVQIETVSSTLVKK